MGRPARFWFRKQTKTYYITLDGKQINLGKDKAKAEKQFHKLMAAEAPPPQDTSVAQLLDAFLVWTQSHRAPRTFEWYCRHLQSFLDSLANQTINASAIRPKHVAQWLDPAWAKTTQRGAMVAVQRAFKWGARQGYLEASPLEHLEKPMAERRDNCPTKEDYEVIMAAVNDCFRDVLEFAWISGARPQEIMAMEDRHIEVDKVIFPVHESKGKKRKRVIYLTDRAKELVAGRRGYVFKNRRGGKWNAFNVNNRMCRLAKKTGKKFALVDFRHAFATRMLESGLDHLTVAKLMGHADASMLAKHYSHIGEKNDYLLEQLKRAN